MDFTRRTFQKVADGVEADFPDLCKIAPRQVSGTYVGEVLDNMESNGRICHSVLGPEAGVALVPRRAI